MLSATQQHVSVFDENNMVMSLPRWRKAIGIAVIALAIEVTINFLTGSMPESSVYRTVFSVVFAVPLLPVGLVMDRVSISPHDPTLPILLLLVTFIYFTVCAWLILTVIGACRQRRSSADPEYSKKLN